MPKHDFNDYKLLVGQQAMKGYKRLLANGVSADFEDVYQQMSLTFCVASDKFDPERGFEFSTYLVRAIWIEFNKFAESQINHRQHIMSADRFGDDEEGHSLYDVMPSSSMTPDEEVELRLTNERKFEKLSPHAKNVLTALISPSAELDDEWKAKKAHQMQGRKLGVSSRRLPDDMNFTFLYDQLKVPARRRADIKRELSSAFGVNLS